jgi:hypothetical protein
VAAIAVEVADTGARQGPFEDPATEAGFRAAFCTFSPRLTLRKTGPLLMPVLAQPLVERPDRAGAFRKRCMLGLAAAGDLDFPSLPLLVGLRFGQGRHWSLSLIRFGEFGEAAVVGGFDGGGIRGSLRVVHDRSDEASVERLSDGTRRS